MTKIDVRLAESFTAERPQEVARLLEDEPAAGFGEFIDGIAPSTGAELLRYVSASRAAQALEHLDVAHAAALVTLMGIERASPIVRLVAASKKSNILRACDERTRVALERVLAYPSGTAGDRMDSSVSSVPVDATVGDVVERLRADAGRTLYYVYFTSEDHRLVGVTTLRELMLASAETPVRSMMTPSPASLRASQGAQSIASHPAWAFAHALPVVDRNGAFLGALRYETIRVIERELGRGIVSSNAKQTAVALGEVYGLALAGFVGWAATTVTGLADRGGDTP